MKKLKTIRDNNDTKNEAGVILVVAEMPNSPDGYFQLYYDFDCTKPVPIEEAEIYYSSGRLCGLVEGDEENGIQRIVNVGGLLMFGYDDECPNGYYLTMNDMISSEGSESGSSGPSMIGYVNVDINESGTPEFNSYGMPEGDIYNLIKVGSMNEIYDALAGKFIRATFNMHVSGMEGAFPGIVILPFCSAMTITEYNGVHLGYISFTGMLDAGDGEADPVTLRFIVGAEGDTGTITEEMKIQMPH